MNLIAPFRGSFRAVVNSILVSGVIASVCGAASAADQPSGVVDAALATRSGPRGTTLFTALQPPQTGIVVENNYSDPKMWAEHYQELIYGGIGTGVAIGDYDNDEKPDIYVVSKTERSRLFRNLGNWKFEDVTDRAFSDVAVTSWTDRVKSWWDGSEAGGDSQEAWKQGAAFADINNDGLLDLYVCRFGAPNLLYVNRGDGTFSEEAVARGLAVVDGSGMAAFCDYDRDGWLDVYVQTNMLNATTHPNGRPDYLFHNNGDGTFTNVTEQAGVAGESAGHSASWWDYDADGWMDIYVANDFATVDRLYRNNRDGTFTDVAHAVLPHLPYYAMGSDVGDVNNDGAFDLFVGDMTPSSHEKDQRGMAGSRERAQVYPADPATAPQYMRNALYLGTGTGHVLEAAQLAGLEATDWTWSVRLEDLDNDGRVDLHVTNGMAREYHNADLLEELMGAENPNESRRLMKSKPRLDEKNFAFRNLGDLRFESVGTTWGLDEKGVSFGAAFGDLDGDGDLDVVYSNYEKGVTVLRNDSESGHRITIALRGTRSNRFGVGARVRVETAAGVQVRQLSVARGYLSSSEPILHFGLGGDTRITRLTVTWPSGETQTFEDLGADRRFTITEPAKSAGTSVASAPEPRQYIDESDRRGLSLRSEESFQPEQQPLLPMRFDRRGPALALGDLNGDRQDDLILGGTGAQPARIYIGGDRFLPASNLPTSALDDGPLLIFDANGDGRPDLLQTKAGTNKPAGSPEYQPILYSNEASGFIPVNDALPPLPISAGAAAAADFDRDGDLDVFMGGRVLVGGYPASPQSALLRNQGARFENVTDLLAAGLREAGMVSSALWSDVDQDGWPDLLLALEWGGVKYWHNDAGRAFTDWSERAGFAAGGVGWWTSLSSADFNGDNRLDYVAGNVGLNTSYQAPAFLFLGRFGTGKAPQLIEAHREGERLYPRRTVSALSAHVPAVKRRFPKNNDYGKASITEIFDDDRLRAALRYEATEFQSGVFMSQANGGYRFQPLARIAQIAPLQGMVTGDFNGDGYSDLYAVQNSYAPIPSVGRFDGGLSQLLLGNGNGQLTPAAPSETGLIVPGDAKALVTADFDADGWPDFLISRNNATTVAWRNTGVPGSQSFRVLLKGKTGNPSAVGAMVSLELSDGTQQHQELTAGSSYYSQSAGACFFGYPNGNPPRRLVVRWPHGGTTEQIFAAPPPSTLIVPAP